MLVEERPLRDHNQEGKCCATETDVESLVDILGDEAGEEGNHSYYREEAVGYVFGESLAFEVLRGQLSDDGCKS